MKISGKLLNLNSFGFPDSTAFLRRKRKKMAKPNKKWNYGFIEVAQWENKTKDDKTFYTYTVGNAYKDGEEIKSSNSFTRDDLLKLSHVINSALLDTIKVR